MIAMILVDLQKAFDTIYHDLLLKKFNAIGFSNHTIGWFKSHYSNRWFRVNLENCHSDPSNITCGVPQGAILGPLLFLICVNATGCEIKSVLYADASCLFFRERML